MKCSVRSSKTICFLRSMFHSPMSFYFPSIAYIFKKEKTDFEFEKEFFNAADKYPSEYSQETPSL